MEREYQIATTELTDDELAAVSGGFYDLLVSSVVAGGGGGTVGTGTGTGTAGWDIRKSKA
jgi:lactobin A/cerein 7B family class IIb bacteriocin